MRILPRSRRGTWLLAGAVWCAACMCVWSGTPGKPRITFNVGAPAGWMEFTPDGTCLVTCGFDRDQSDRQNSRGRLGQFRYWGCSTGKQVGESVRVWAENPFADRVSPDRRWWYLGWAGESPELKVFDVQNRRVDVLPIVGSGQFYWFAYSPNSRFMIVENDSKGGHELVVWDLPERRIRHTLRRQRTPMDVSPDNQLLAALVWDEKSPQIIQLTDLESGRIVETIRDAPQERGYHLRFSGDGSLLAAIATHTITAKLKSGVSDPEACRARLLGSWRVPGVHRPGFPTNRHDRFVTVPHAQTFMTYEPTNDEMYVVTRDMMSGAIQRQLWVHNAPMGFFEPYFLTPNGEMMIAQGLDSRITYLERLAMHFKVPLKGDVTGYKSESHIYKTASGRHVCDIPGWNPIWSPDGRTIAVNLANQCPDGEVELWDVPPAKQLDWFAVGAALIGLPIIPVAWLRARMLRSA